MTNRQILEKLAATLGTQVDIDCNTLDGREVYSAKLQYVEVKLGAALSSPWGQGKTLEAACKDAVLQYGGQTLVYHAMHTDRRELLFVRVEA